MSERIPGVRAIAVLLIFVLAEMALRGLPLPLEQIFIVLLTAVLIASAVTPACDYAQQRWHVPRGVTILIMYLLAILVLAGVVFLIVPLINGEVDRLRDKLPEYDASVRRQIERFAPGQSQKVTTSDLVDRAFGELGNSFGRATGFAVSLSSGLVRLVIVLVLGFFLAAEKGFAERVVTRFAPPEHRRRWNGLLATIANQLGHWARAQVLLALAFGISFGVGLKLIGVPYAATLGVIGGVLEIIPYIGGFITVGLAVLVALTASHGIISVVLVVVWYTIVIQLEAHVVAPYLMKRAVGLHPLVVVLALFVGTEALGILGALLAVPIAVIIQALLDEFYSFDSEESTPRPVASPHIDASSDQGAPDAGPEESH